MTLTRRDFSKMVLASGAAGVLAEGGWPISASAASQEKTLNVAPETSKEDRKYDLLIKGGTVIDPSQRIHAPMDVAVRGSKIAALARDIPESQAIQVISAKGRIVTPGLIDLATHVCEKLVRVCVNADHYCLGRGVTTVMETGGVGAQNLPGAMMYVIHPSLTRIFVGLNIYPAGYAYRAGIAEHDSVAAMDPKLAARAAEENRPVVVGIKCYVEQAHVGKQDMQSLARTMEAAELSHLPVVADINDSYSPLPMIVNKLRKGDVFTHFYSNHPHGVLDANGKILPAVWEARKRGVFFDTGDGYGQVSFDVVEKCFEQGFYPDSISTDLMTGNVYRWVYDLPTEMSKFMALGMSLDQVIECTTSGPAKTFAYGVQIGTLKPGSEADIGVFELRDQKFEFVGSHHTVKRVGHQLLVNKAVVCRGKFFVNSV